MLISKLIKKKKVYSQIYILQYIYLKIFINPNAASTIIPTAIKPNPAKTVACVEANPAVTLPSAVDGSAALT